MSSDVESSQNEQQYNSEDERRCQQEWAEYEVRRAAFDLKCAESKKKKLKALAVQNKRDQWKAASARYYERHPEVKEKKRVKAAEQRWSPLFSAAKKLARRRWDPAPKRKSNQPSGDSREDLDLDPTPDANEAICTVELWASGLSDTLKNDPKVPAPAQVFAAKSLLQLGEQPSLGCDCRFVLISRTPIRQQVGRSHQLPFKRISSDRSDDE
ncbi:hypothetical protein B0H14DRAFT_2632703 [Mycena olivaceomarginata]|nr:hypothetical protein B0H14DRAFT_2632703 [Mycena olivaceomarginata]